MYYIIYGGVVLFALYMGRNWIKGAIITHIQKRKKVVQKKVDSDLVYVPIKSSRTFQFLIQIDELGDGQASISVVKNKA
jgi:hypothetical protein